MHPKHFIKSLSIKAKTKIKKLIFLELPSVISILLEYKNVILQPK